MPSSLATSLLANADSSSGSSILSFLFLPGILLLMYFLLVRPQRKRVREQQMVQSSIEVGQDVVTTSGIFGTITGEDGDHRFWLEIDDDVQIRIARAAIQNVVTPDDLDETTATTEIDEIDETADDSMDDDNDGS